MYLSSIQHLQKITLNMLMSVNYYLELRNAITMYSLCHGIKVTFGEISLKPCRTSWNVAKNNVKVVADDLPSQITIYTYLTTDIWTRWHWRTSTQFYALWCHPPKMVGFLWYWHQKLLTLLWTPLAHQEALSELCNTRNFMLKVWKMTLSP